jgi:hypothetical protein
MSFIKTLNRTGPRIDPCGTPLINVSIDWFSKNLMKANPDKFQAIAIGPKTNKHNLSFDLKGNKITERTTVLNITKNVFFSTLHKKLTISNNLWKVRPIRILYLLDTAF